MVVATPVVSVPPMMAVSMTTPSTLAVVPMVTARATIGVHVRAPVTWKKGGSLVIKQIIVLKQPKEKMDRLFSKYENLLRKTLGDNVVAVFAMGSGAIPG